MENTDKIQLFERTPIPKAVLTLSVPTIISSLVMVIYNLADTYFVGMLNDPVQNAAVTLAAPVLLAFNAINNLFGVGSSSMMSRAATAAYLRWTVTCGAAPAILNVVLAYLVRTEGASLHASIGTMSGCLLNIVLDPLFILPQGLNMGVAGPSRGNYNRELEFGGWARGEFEP